MKIAVINIYNFPEGMAATNRIIGYCKGLIQLGVKVDIISIVPKIDISTPLSGICDGGNYFHFTKLVSYKLPIIRVIESRIKIKYNQYKALSFIKKSDKQDPYDAIILSFDEPATFKVIVPPLKTLQKAKIIAIADEYPIPIRHYLKPVVPEQKLKKYRQVYKDIDGRILMTSKLKDFYDTNVCFKPTLILSTIVDINRFEKIIKSNLKRDYLCYMGNMELSKDNVDNIIKAFALISNKYQNLDLYLYGTPTQKTKLYLEKLICQKRLNNRVFLKGYVDYITVPQVLANAQILVSSQPNTKRAEGGFPTKLGEYMMTGVPTLLTDVGEISNYVKDKYNAYLVAPDNSQLYAERLSYILENYKEALEVATRAKSYIINNFSASVAGKKIINFLSNTQF